MGGKVLQKLGLDHDLPRVSAPGGGGFASIDHLHFLLPHIPPRWGGSGIPLTHTLAPGLSIDTKFNAGQCLVSEPLQTAETAYSIIL